ncbi:hypothetical protein R1flu_009819 [Riccia fluitans]|uniref:Uncharacterized protein n=1 Tax=Riccia fluitans TaxID=41844 RepID=A0ABD1Z672_9MARC
MLRTQLAGLVSKLQHHLHPPVVRKEELDVEMECRDARSRDAEQSYESGGALLHSEQDLRTENSPHGSLYYMRQ